MTRSRMDEHPGVSASRLRPVRALLGLSCTLVVAVSGITTPALAAAPDPPSLPSPAHEAVSVPTLATLEVSVSDPDGDSLTVTFYGRPISTTVGPTFTIVKLPDTQNYVSFWGGGTPAIFHAQTQWIAANRALRNIVYVPQVGDLVQNEDNNGDPIEWTYADSAMRRLEDPATTLLPEGIPFGVSPGNHDINGSGAAVFYNQYFGVGRFGGRSYYGGHYGENNDNFFHLFKASGLKFIAIGLKLSWAQDPLVLAWADSLLGAHPDRRGIVYTHDMIGQGSPGAWHPQGISIYNGLKNRPNLFLMLAGHVCEEGRRADTWNGDTVHTVMADYQCRANGGDGWLRIMEFSPAENVIRVRTYSPWLDRFEADADSSSQFTIPCDLSGGDGSYDLIARFPRVASGSTLSIPWFGLSRGQRYQWYVTVSDSSSTVAGPECSFLTWEADPPAVQIVAPSAGQVLTMGALATIQWSASDTSGVTGVDILLSRTGPGGPFVPLFNAIENSGSANWWVNGPPTANAWFMIRARDVPGNVGEIVSEAPVTIASTTGVDDAARPGVALGPMTPNPMRGAGRFSVTLAEAGTLRLGIFDLEGREVARLANGTGAAGRREFSWNGRTARGPAHPGVYVVRLETASGTLARRFVLTR